MKFFYLLLLIGILSCSKRIQVINKKNMVFKQTYPIQNISNKKKVSDILIETISYFTEKIIYDDIHFNGSLKKDNNDSISSITFNNVSLEWKRTYFDSSISTITQNQIFGEQLNIEVLGFKKGISTSSELKIGYVPQKIIPTNDIQNCSLYNNGDYFSGTILKPNFKLTWEKDSLNKNGVFIYLEFDSKHLGNEKHLNNSSKIISNLIFVEDNGLYTLDEKMFEGFPSNSVIGLYMGRTNIFIFKKNRQYKTPFQLLTASSCRGDFYYKSN